MNGPDKQPDMYVFWTCLVSLVATSFGFISRVFLLDVWQVEFNLSEANKGEIFGAGLWPFAISIVLFSLVVDRIGYGRSMIFAVAAHGISGVMTIFANGYHMLYWAAFIGGLGNGTIEAVINPVVAGMFRTNKTKWLNVLHAGWPGGLMIAGVITILLGAGVDWRIKAGLIFIPVIAYGAMLIRCRFPDSRPDDRNHSYLAMLREPGGLGIFIVTALIVVELGRVISGAAGVETPFIALLVVSGVIAAAYGVLTRSAGNPVYIFLLLIMLLLATTELGTDGWIKELMAPAMNDLGLDGGWILVYTAAIMTILRFATGPILRITRLSPLGLLAASCVLVILGIVWLSSLDQAGPGIILMAAGIYGAGQCFFWPTTLGYVAERFPTGGALTLNAIAGVGMLGVGILGGPWLGYVQDTQIADQLKENAPELHEQVISTAPSHLWGIFPYHKIDQDRVPAEGKPNLVRVTAIAKRHALFIVAVLPLIMLLSYIALMVVDRRRSPATA